MANEGCGRFGEEQESRRQTRPRFGLAAREVSAERFTLAAFHRNMEAAFGKLDP